jgi:hypothetical protein
MSDILTLGDPRDVDNVLVRVSSGLRRYVAENAKEQNVSQNTYITASLLFSAMVLGALPHLGVPKNFLLLLSEMDKAAKDNDAVLAALNEKDWAAVRPFLELFSTSGVIDGLKARKESETVAYTFHFSRSGLSAWKLIGPKLIESANQFADNNSLFAGQQ